MGGGGQGNIEPLIALEESEKRGPSSQKTWLVTQSGNHHHADPARSRIAARGTKGLSKMASRKRESKPQGAVTGPPPVVNLTIGKEMGPLRRGRPPNRWWGFFSKKTGGQKISRERGQQTSNSQKDRKSHRAACKIVVKRLRRKRWGNRIRC